MTKYTLSEKTVKEHLGATYRPLAYKLGEDYIERKCFKSFKRIYRSDLLDGTLRVEETVEPVTVEDWRAKVTPALKPQQLPASDEATEQTIVMLYPNSRWVKTNVEDKVFVGTRGFSFRKGQKIRVKNKIICTK